MRLRIRSVIIYAGCICVCVWRRGMRMQREGYRRRSRIAMHHFSNIQITVDDANNSTNTMVNSTKIIRNEIKYSPRAEPFASTLDSIKISLKFVVFIEGINLEFN